jgi:hypothetical protein
MEWEEKAETKAEPYNQKYELSDDDVHHEEEEDNSPIEEVRVTVSSKCICPHGVVVCQSGSAKLVDCDN